MEIGMVIFYDIKTGLIILNTGEYKDSVIKKSIEQQIETYKELSERNHDTFDYIELEYGQYRQDFEECGGNYRVNPETKTLEFSYPDPNEPVVEQPYQPPLSEKVTQLEEAQAETNAMLLDFMEASLLG